MDWGAHRTPVVVVEGVDTVVAAAAAIGSESIQHSEVVRQKSSAVSVDETSRGAVWWNNLAFGGVGVEVVSAVALIE